MQEMNDIQKALVDGQTDELLTWVRDALSKGATAVTILDEGLFPGMAKVGRLFREGEFFLPEVLIAARAMNRTLEFLEPHMPGKQSTRKGKVVLATVQGDMHDIGKNLVSIMLRGAGFEVIDLGVDVPKDKIIQAVQEHKPQALGLSALLTTTMLVMKDIMASLEETGLRSQVKVLIGGAAVTRNFADEIGCDGYADNAYDVVALL